MTDDGSKARFFPWSAALERERPARVTLSREQIVDAAIRVLDEEGLDALSMRRLGQELNAGATSLYWHIRNKDELLDLVVDRIIGEVLDEVGEPQGWRAWSRAAAVGLRRVLLRHRGVAPVMGERPTFGPNALLALEQLLTSLRDDGFDPRSALLAATTVVNWASGFAVFEVRDPVGPASTEAEREAYIREFYAFLGSLPPERYPTTVEIVPVGATILPDEQFDYALDVLLDGIWSRELRRRTATEEPA